jgi:hypothetical protein
VIHKVGAAAPNAPVVSSAVDEGVRRLRTQILRPSERLGARFPVRGAEEINHVAAPRVSMGSLQREGSQCHRRRNALCKDRKTVHVPPKVQELNALNPFDAVIAAPDERG